jgi:hypothetical protein
MKYYFVKGSSELAGDETKLETSIPIPKNGYMIRLTIKDRQKPMLLVKTGSGRTASQFIEQCDLGDFELANIASGLLASLDVHTFVRPARYAIAFNTSDTTVYVDMDQ